ncbi:hypothetical protein ABZZ20_08035 [Streptomyces sp. NPDC006430]|uniref:PASTA domain-containing protein n=1 Tax=Streptomyces sp. NPDC006430 TaxID=3154299 RepID=UPI0033B9F5F3
MRTHHVIAALAIAGALTLTGCQDTTASPGRPAASGPTATATTPGTSGGPIRTLPDFVGKGLQSAQDEAQAAGFPVLKSHDALGRGRLQAMDRNWKVCTQVPAAGAAVHTDTTVDFGAVKLDETCPAQDAGTPAEAAGSMPDFIGKSLKTARTTLPSNTSISVKDAAQNRVVIQETNWKVCVQDPAAGTRLTGQPVSFTVVKFPEDCP